ncbi:hypothetical protein ACFLZ5_11205 [Thermodesulfobacteriota bacterium]
MIKRAELLALIFVFLVIVIFSGCSTKQKTMGQGMVSVVAQNVVRIAGIKAMKDANLTAVKGKKTFVKTTGFADDFNRGFIDNLVRSKAEDAGCLLVNENSAEIIIEVAVNSAGNDLGATKIPLLSNSTRTEGTVDLSLTLRDNNSGQRISKQSIIGHSKYEQGEIIGIQGSGQYYVKEKAKFIKVDNPSSYN